MALPHKPIGYLPQTHMTQDESIRAFPRTVLTGVVREEPVFCAVPEDVRMNV